MKSAYSLINNKKILEYGKSIIFGKDSKISKLIYDYDAYDTCPTIKSSIDSNSNEETLISTTISINSAVNGGNIKLLSLPDGLGTPKSGITYNNKITTYNTIYTNLTVNTLNVNGDKIIYKTINTSGKFHADNLSNTSKIKVNNNISTLEANCESIESKDFITKQISITALNMNGNKLNITKIDNSNTTIKNDITEIIEKANINSVNIKSGNWNVTNYKNIDDSNYTSKDINVTQSYNSENDYTSTINVDTVTLQANLSYTLTDNIKGRREFSSF